MDFDAFLTKLNASPADCCFVDILAAIDNDFSLTPCRFHNGPLVNEAGSNLGSLRVFALAKRLGLSDPQCLALFAEHYRQVLATPTGQDHANIRQFMRTGLAGVQFDGEPLSAR